MEILDVEVLMRKPVVTEDQGRPWSFFVSVCPVLGEALCSWWGLGCQLRLRAAFSLPPAFSWDACLARPVFSDTSKRRPGVAGAVPGYIADSFVEKCPASDERTWVCSLDLRFITIFACQGMFFCLFLLPSLPCPPTLLPAFVFCLSFWCIRRVTNCAR